MQTVSNVQEILASAEKKQASAEEKQERMETMLSFADYELFGVKEKLQQTESLLLAANYGSFIKSLGVECMDHKQSVEYVSTLLDKLMQILFEMGGTLYTCGR